MKWVTPDVDVGLYGLDAFVDGACCGRPTMHQRVVPVKPVSQPQQSLAFGVLTRVFHDDEDEDPPFDVGGVSAGGLGVARDAGHGVFVLLDAGLGRDESVAVLAGASKGALRPAGAAMGPQARWVSGAC